MGARTISTNPVALKGNTMKNLIAAILAVSLTPLPAMADEEKVAGCDITFPILSGFDEDVNGNNCPATDFEEAVGGALVIAAFAGLLHVTGAVQIFPLNGVGSAFSGRSAVAVLPVLP